MFSSCDVSWIDELLSNILYQVFSDLLIYQMPKCNLTFWISFDIKELKDTESQAILNGSTKAASLDAKQLGCGIPLINKG